MQAMADELSRSMSSLKLPDQPAPYYIEYEVQDRISTRITARLGALVEDLVGRNRVLRVGVRVGNYDFDSSLFAGGGTTGGVIGLSADGSTSAPLDDDYDTMRRQIWLATDAAYKRAVSVYAQKVAAFQNRLGQPSLPDFSQEPAQRMSRPMQAHLDHALGHAHDLRGFGGVQFLDVAQQEHGPIDVGQPVDRGPDEIARLTRLHQE